MLMIKLCRIFKLKSEVHVFKYIRKITITTIIAAILLNGTAPYASAKTTPLPASYDARKKHIATSIKDQGSTGICWSFAAIKTLEMNAVKKGFFPLEKADFSENHLSWYTYNTTTDENNPMYGDKRIIKNLDSSKNPLIQSYKLGGLVSYAVATLSQWSGVVMEEDSPFLGQTLEEVEGMAEGMTDMGEELRYHSVAHLQNADCYDNASRDEIKRAILEKGAVDISLYYDKSGFENKKGSGVSYYQKKYKGAVAKEYANHCVTIIGWNDKYSRNKFRNKPSSDGAWLVANSYGTDVNKLKGYFWLSYKEPSICDIYSMELEPVDNYDYNYQYDGIGWTDAIYFNSKDISGANVFENNTESSQELKAVSIYTLDDKQSYTIDVYKNVSGNTPVSGEHVEGCTISGTAKYTGYHTIKLPESCVIEPGEKFSVVVRYKYKKKTGHEAYLPIEGEDYESDIFEYKFSSKKGQSYYLLDNRWVDLYSENRNNVCIKAFTSDIIS
ncbi:MAG: hypothetical protein II243_07430 [Lachnospiraceae bacterium]|nr:hypothetical protein [Lachnospiraceae bacterium]